jgi:DNA modification methylase
MAQCGSVPSDSTELLGSFLERYARHGRAIPVNFRQMVDWVPSGDRATHFIHPYPAKLLRQIPVFFLANRLLSSPGDTVLDPFCGSGTVLLESVLHERHGVGADANPLARLIAKVKVTRLTATSASTCLRAVLRRAKAYVRADVPDVVNLEYWFYPHVANQLARLRRSIDQLQDETERDFFLVCFSACVRRVSLADPRVAVPVRLRSDQYPTDHILHQATKEHLAGLRSQDVFETFDVIARANIARLDDLASLWPNTAHASISSSDARELRDPASERRRMRKGSIDLIITSPPYLGAQKYVRASSLSLGWLGATAHETLRQLEDQNIGREHFSLSKVANLPSTGLSSADERIRQIAGINPLRALIAATYLAEMRAALTEAVRVLRPRGYLVLIAANNFVCGKEFMTQRYLQQLLEELGLKTRLRLIDAIKSRGLMTRRNATASVITREWALVLEKTRT